MLTRKSVEIKLDPDHEDRCYTMTDVQLAAEERALDREIEIIEQRYAEKMRSMSVLQRYRHERREALIMLLRSRARRQRLIELNAPEFVIENDYAFFRKRQHTLLDWRRYLQTGILPSPIKN